MNELLELMNKYNDGEYGAGSLVSIVIFADGSGSILDIDDAKIFTFNNIDELREHLKSK